jgi:hypothetical protein
MLKSKEVQWERMVTVMAHGGRLSESSVPMGFSLCPKSEFISKSELFSNL